MRPFSFYCTYFYGQKSSFGDLAFTPYAAPTPYAVPTPYAASEAAAGVFTGARGGVSLPFL